MDRIFEALQEQGRTQRWLTRQLQLPHESYLSKYRSGVLAPPADVLRRAAVLLGIPLEEVVPAIGESPIGDDMGEMVDDRTAIAP